jgi:hypothetical protein
MGNRSTEKYKSQPITNYQLPITQLLFASEAKIAKVTGLLFDAGS